MSGHGTEGVVSPGSPEAGPDPSAAQAPAPRLHPRAVHSSGTRGEARSDEMSTKQPRPLPADYRDEVSSSHSSGSRDQDKNSSREGDGFKTSTPSHSPRSKKREEKREELQERDRAAAKYEDDRRLQAAGMQGMRELDIGRESEAIPTNSPESQPQEQSSASSDAELRSLQPSGSTPEGYRNISPAEVEERLRKWSETRKSPSGPQGTQSDAPPSESRYGLRPRPTEGIIQRALQSVASKWDPSTYSRTSDSAGQRNVRGVRSRSSSGSRAQIRDYQVTSETGLQTADIVPSAPSTDRQVQPIQTMPTVQDGERSVRGRPERRNGSRSVNNTTRSVGFQQPRQRNLAAEEYTETSSLRKKRERSPTSSEESSEAPRGQFPGARGESENTQGTTESGSAGGSWGSLTGDRASGRMGGQVTHHTSVARRRTSDDSAETSTPPYAPCTGREDRELADNVHAPMRRSSGDHAPGTSLGPSPGFTRDIESRDTPRPVIDVNRNPYPPIAHLDHDQGFGGSLAWDPHMDPGRVFPTPSRSVMPPKPGEAEELFEALDRLTDDIHVQQAMRESAERQNQVQSQRIEQLTAALTAAEEGQEMARVETARMEALYERTEQQLENQRTTLANLRETMAETEFRYQQKEHEGQRRVTRLSEALREATTRQQLVQQRCEEIQQSRATVEDEVSVLRARLESMNIELQEAHVTYSKLREDYAKAAQAEDECWGKMNQLQKDLRVMRTRSEDERRRRAQLEEHLRRIAASSEASLHLETQTPPPENRDVMSAVKREPAAASSYRDLPHMANDRTVVNGPSSRPTEAGSRESLGRGSSQGHKNQTEGLHMLSSHRSRKPDSGPGGSPPPPPDDDSGGDSSDEDVDRHVFKMPKMLYTTGQPRDFKLPTFTGKMSEDAMAWWRKVENEFSMHHMTWAVQKGVIYRNLGGAAQVWFDSLADTPGVVKGPLSSLRRFKEAFLAKFTAQDTKLMAEYAWNRRKQRVGEAVDDYVNEMVIVGHQIGVTESEKFKTILRGLLPVIQAEVMKMRPKNLDELITNARIASASADLTQGPVTAAVAAMGEVTEAVRGLPEAIQAVIREGQSQLQAISAPPQQVLTETGRRAPGYGPRPGYQGQNNYNNPPVRTQPPRGLPPQGVGRVDNRSGCHSCGAMDHWKSECPYKTPGPGPAPVVYSRPQCFTCGSMDHFRRDCPNGNRGPGEPGSWSGQGNGPPRRPPGSVWGPPGNQTGPRTWNSGKGPSYDGRPHQGRQGASPYSPGQPQGN